MAVSAERPPQDSPCARPCADDQPLPLSGRKSRGGGAEPHPSVQREQGSAGVHRAGLVAADVHDHSAVPEHSLAAPGARAWSFGAVVSPDGAGPGGGWTTGAGRARRVRVDPQELAEEGPDVLGVVVLVVPAAAVARRPRGSRPARTAAGRRCGSTSEECSMASTGGGWPDPRPRGRPERVLVDADVPAAGREVDVEAAARRVVGRGHHREQATLAAVLNPKGATLRYGVGRTAPFTTSRTLPPCSATNSRDGSPGGAPRATGRSKAPVRGWVSSVPAVAPGTRRTTWLP